MTRTLIPPEMPQRFRFPSLRLLNQFCLSLVLTLGFVLCAGSLAQAGGLIPETAPVFTKTGLKVGKTVTINGHPVNQGHAGPASVIQTDGIRAKESTTLPALEPATFPANGSTTDATDANSPFVSPGEVFYREITIAHGAKASFVGGGTFHIHELILKEEGTVRLGKGTYFINKLKMYGKRTQLIVTSAPVVLHIGKEFVAGNDDIVVNPGGTVTGLRVYLHANAEVKGSEGFQFTGLIYGPHSKRVKLKEGVTFRGPIMTSGEILLGENVALTYTASDQAAVKAVELGTSSP